MALYQGNKLISGGGVQSDWNQNDTEAKDYVKNRTHWEDNSKNIVSESRCTTTSDGDTPPYTYTFTLNTDKVVDTYLIVFGANEVLSVELTNNNDPIWVTDRLGEEILLSISVVQEESEIVATLSFNVPNYDGVETYVYELVPEIHKLDEKFLPDTVATKEYVDQNASGGIFIAESYVTTSAEIEAAYQSGKLVVCVDAGMPFHLVFRRSATEHWFANVDSEYYCTYSVINDEWEFHENRYAPRDHAYIHKATGRDPITPESIGALAAPAPTQSDNGKVLGVENGIPVWSDANVFVATYGVTTYEEISDALAEGKPALCYMPNNGGHYVAMYTESDIKEHVFICPRSIGAYTWYCQRTDSGTSWGVNTYGYSPSNHAWEHSTEGYDPITPEMIGAVTKEYVDAKISSIPTPDVSGQINTHNTSSSAHSDIRQLIANKKGAQVYETTIGTSWTENSDTGVKTQTVSISGVTASNTAKVDHSSASVDGTSEGYATFVEEENQYLEFITNGYAETVAGGIKFTIFGDPNTVAIPIVVEVV